jgi:hypothetical protein
MLAIALLAVLGGIAIPQALGTLDSARTGAAARYVVSRLMLARAQAVQRSASVAIRIDRDTRGFRVAAYQDSNRNGVRSRDIELQIDRAIEREVRLPELFPGVDFGLSIDGQAADPIQLGGTSLLTFTPTGTATSGSLYIRGRNGLQYAVRVIGATGRTRLQRYDERQHGWRDEF